jgi:hypothetical protein
MSCVLLTDFHTCRSSLMGSPVPNVHVEYQSCFYLPHWVGFVHSVALHVRRLHVLKSFWLTCLQQHAGGIGVQEGVR